ncbi:9142_t:CDS:2, partial [Gigaspora rosea]
IRILRDPEKFLSPNIARLREVHRWSSPKTKSNLTNPIKTSGPKLSNNHLVSNSGTTQSTQAHKRSATLGQPPCNNTRPCERKSDPANINEAQRPKPTYEVRKNPEYRNKDPLGKAKRTRPPK